MLCDARSPYKPVPRGAGLALDRTDQGDVPHRNGGFESLDGPERWMVRLISGE